MRRHSGVASERSLDRLMGVPRPQHPVSDKIH